MAVKAAGRLLAGRLAGLAATAWLLATLCFAFTHALPGDLALRVAAARGGEDRLTAEGIERVRREEGLDRPLGAQYLAWLARTARGDLGRSLVSRRPVGEELAEHGRRTLTLALLGFGLTYALALPLGAAAGFNPGGHLDRATTGLTAVFAALPAFVTGLGLVALFALTLRWLPPAGSRSPAHLVLPALTLALALVPYAVRVVRGAVAEVRGAFHLTFAQIGGLTPRAAFRRHGVRNAAVPVVTFAALQLGALLDGFVVVETLFAYPGLGDLLVKSLLARDVPVVIGVALVAGLAYGAVNLAADLAALRLDPRRAARPA